MLVLSDDSDGGTNRLVDEKKLYFDDYLCFKGDKLRTVHEKDILPKRNDVGNESRTLHPIASDKHDNKSGTGMECRLCLRSINSDNFSCYCPKCHCVTIVGIQSYAIKFHQL